MAWSFVGKYEQVSTYVSWKIPLYQNYKRKKEKYSSNGLWPLTAEIENNN